MGKAKDKREEKIKRAFLDLVEEKGFSKVSVKDIAEKSGITRGTFYLYFEDKYDLLHSVEQNFFEDMINATKNVPYIKVAYNGVNEEYLKAFISFFKQNGKTFALLCGEKGEAGFALRTKKKIYNYWKEQQLLNNLVVPEKYAVTAITDITNGIILEWINGGYKESEEELIEIIKHISGNLLPNIFKK